jgi:SAM-dependent methyltransferase
MEPKNQQSGVNQWSSGNKWSGCCQWTSWEHWVQRVLEIPLGHVADLACGDGEFIEEFLVLGSHPNSVTLIDLDPNSISEAKRYFTNHGPSTTHFTYIAGDVLTFLETMDSSVATSTWDTLLLGLALHHLPDPENLITQVTTRLNPGGRLIVSEVVRNPELLNSAQITARDMHHLKAQVDRLLGISHRETYGIQDLVEFMAPSEWDLTLTPDPQDDRYLFGHPDPNQPFNPQQSHCQDSHFLVPQPELSDQEISEQTKDNEHRIEFLREYLLHAKHEDTYPILRREFTRLRYQITNTGYQLPPRLNGIFTARNSGGTLNG